MFFMMLWILYLSYRAEVKVLFLLVPKLSSSVLLQNTISFHLFLQHLEERGGKVIEKQLKPKHLLEDKTTNNILKCLPRRAEMVANQNKQLYTPQFNFMELNHSTRTRSGDATAISSKLRNKVPVFFRRFSLLYSLLFVSIGRNSCFKMSTR